LGKLYQEKTIQDILMLKMITSTDETAKKKKKKKPKKPLGQKNDEAGPSTESEKMEIDAAQEEEKENDKMDVDGQQPESTAAAEEVPLIDNLPKSIRDIVPVEKIIKSNEVFSPEKVDSPVTTPIQVRKTPRLPQEMTSKTNDDDKKSPENQVNLKKFDAVTTPKASPIIHHSKTPTPIEVRRHPRVLQPAPASKAKEIDEDDHWPKPFDSPMERRPPVPIGASPKTPRRIELQTLSTPKSKKKLL
jgi:hypothetical protein